MNKKSLFNISALVLLTVGVLVGCQTGNTDGGDIDHTSTQYDPDASGDMRLLLVDGDELAVGRIKSFRVYATDSQGQPVTQLRVTCDTEAGLALVEPTTGFESTDSNGQVSGKVGCTNPGSYLLACRLQGVSARRQSVTVKCSGNRPEGFTGFAGSGGGTLGGGSTIVDNITTVRVTSITVSDTGDSTAATTSIDIQQGVCTSAGTSTLEPFFDSSVTFAITNNSPFVVRIKSVRYTLSDAFANGRSFTSDSLGVTGSAASAVDANGGTATFTSLFLDANGGGKRYFGASRNIDTTGFKNIAFTITGENDFGDEFVINANTALSFDNFNRCSTS